MSMANVEEGPPPSSITANLDPSMPAWKRELILRKRRANLNAVRAAVAISGTHSTGGAADWSSAGNFSSRGVGEAGGCCTSFAGSTSSNHTELQHLLAMGEERVLNGDSGGGGGGGGAVDHRFNDVSPPGSDTGEELQYGPGIVNRLKSKYLSIAARNTADRNSYNSRTWQQRDHPIRRVASLENWLDKDVAESTPAPTPTTNDESQFTVNNKLVNGNVNNNINNNRQPLYQKHTRGRIANKALPTEQKTPQISVSGGKDRRPQHMKRARSVDALSRYYNNNFGQTSKPPEEVSARRTSPVDKARRPRSLLVPSLNGPKSPPASPVLINEDVVIVEANDAPKQKAKVVPSSAGPQQQEMPPPDKVKSTKRIFESQQPPKPAKPVKLRNGYIPMPKSVPTMLSPTAKPPKPPINNSPRSVPTSDSDDDSETTGTKVVSKSAIEGIRRDSASLQFNFTNNHGNVPNKTAQDSPSYLPRKVPQEGSVAPKQVGVIRPIPLPRRDAERNRINEAKNAVVAATSNGEVEESPSAAQQKRSWQKPPSGPATMVFDFTKSKEKNVPDYIEDDGIRTSSSLEGRNCSSKKAKKARKLNRLKAAREPGFVLLDSGRRSTESSDFEDTTDGASDGESDDDEEEEYDDWQSMGPPTPCNIEFIGANIIVNGKSSLQKKPKQAKQKITFNDSATCLFEYPSEASTLMEMEGEASPEGTNGGFRNNTLGTLGGLASYTPSKSQTEYQLGVTATPAAKTESAPTTNGSPGAVDEYLRPASDDQTVTWSSGTSASDLLF